MSDHQNPDQPLQELATAAQLDEELEQQQQKELEQRQQLLQQQQQAELEARRQAEALVQDTSNHASSSAAPQSAQSINLPVSGATSEQLAASSLGDVDAVIAAAVNASKQHAEQERLQEEQQQRAAQAGSAMDLDPAVQPQSDIDPSAAVAGVPRASGQNADDSMQHGEDPDASMMTDGGSPIKHDGDASVNLTGTPKPKKERAKPKPRSKSATKITRFRKITSCLQCREKKQKCDRVKPICGNCRENPTDDPCHYVDDRKRPGSDDEDHAGDASISSPAARKRKEPEDAFLSTGNSRVFKRADFPRVDDRRQALMLQTRRETVDKLEEVGKDRSRDFNTRVNAARAAAIADVLFESAITLPTADEISALLYTYKTQVEPFVNVVVIDINIARIQSFLRWWHSKPTTMPADPPLVPLLLVILALTLQVKRNSPEFEGHNLTNFAPIPGIECSDERKLLSVAGHCIDALQIACPSAWSSAFQAPIDLTKASLLRGIWHLNELNLQFAGTCFALTTRLAHAAGLHRDPEHWSGMRIEEAQARRNLWWNIVFFEVAHAHRIGQPPCLTHEGFDTQYPDDYNALYAMYERAGLADPDPSRIILPPGATALVPRTPSQTNFEYHWARFRIYHIFLRQSQQLFRFGISSPPDPNLNDEYAKWRENLPEKLKLHFERRFKGSVRPSAELLAQVASQSFSNRVYDPKITEELQDYQQGYSLEFMYHQCMITLHRPYIDEQGAWKPPESVQKSLEVCLQSAEALINTVEDVLAVMPANSMYNQCAYFAFNAGLILAIHCKLDPNSQVHRPHIQKALDLLDTLSSMARLNNVAEQAGRYSSTLKQMLSGIGGDLAALATSKSTSASTSAAERQNGDSNGDVAGVGEATDSRGDAILAALDPSLGGDAARDGGDSSSRIDVDGGPDRIPAFLLPFVGLPTDPNNLGPQAGNSFWNESLLDRPLVGVPVAYPVGFGQGVLSNAEQQNGSAWPQQAGEGDLANTDAGTAGGDLQAQSHEGGLAPDTAAGEGAADDASADAYNLYELLGGRELQPGLPDRPMSFSQHYNHQNPARGDQAPSASYRTYVQNSLARTYDQQQQAKGDGEAGDKTGGENGLSADQLPSESALNAVAAAAAAAAEAEGLDPNAQGNNLAAEWYAWENVSQMLNNRQ
ncbi:Zn(2)-C6 fungal-type DNA-binding domain protein [Kalmanozyma brasiliensis GHG001]|uniref:Zn(2)-C6 fungal-type domain-containing protein n=1 Tax=Kalmanozyma brasiliensis (strain GHG001) TaxID=1365824 RepID=V5EZY7_KALBG|nr:Zn(2)-C6 fungal-type DNA-binding domain protein [Kalmanozyma brasiliensis GHG001]EST09533.1 Zn(2)-C6 fungal-type DNA-binding domain protein [Kalmanozyma brasiliensis GHG001]